MNAARASKGWLVMPSLRCKLRDVKYASMRPQREDAVDAVTPLRRNRCVGPCRHVPPIVGTAALATCHRRRSRRLQRRRWCLELLEIAVCPHGVSAKRVSAHVHASPSITL